MKSTFFKDVQNFLKGDVSTSLTVGYLVLIIIGMLFNGLYYLLWRINIFDYSDISDFLLAPFRDLFILIFTVASIAIIYFLTWIDEKMQEKYPKIYYLMALGYSEERRKDWYSFKSMAFLSIFYVVIAAFMYASFQFKSLRRQLHSSDVTIHTKENQFAPSDTVIYLGKTNTYFFVYVRNKKERVIIPAQEVARVSIMKSKEK
jgi:hypothetical protein